VYGEKDRPTNYSFFFLPPRVSKTNLNTLPYNFDDLVCTRLQTILLSLLCATTIDDDIVYTYTHTKILFYFIFFFCIHDACTIKRRTGVCTRRDVNVHMINNARIMHNGNGRTRIVTVRGGVNTLNVSGRTVRSRSQLYYNVSRREKKNQTLSLNERM